MINAPIDRTAKNHTLVNAILWTLIAFYAASRILQVFPGRVPMLAVVALHVVPPAVFALVHGAIFYRVRGIVAFIAICLIVGTVFENLGVRTGFPYGHYYFTNLMGPKLSVVPVFLALAYVGMGYLSWTLACVILTNPRRPLSGVLMFTLPLAAAFIMVAWDLAMDPIWSTVLHAWIWTRGGSYFGVPLSNFLGWFLTVYIIYQLFALYLRGRAINSRPLPSGHWHMAVLFYAVSAGGNLLLAIPRHKTSMVADATGTQWNVGGITAACALVSIFMMGAFAFLAWARLAGRNATSRESQA